MDRNAILLALHKSNQATKDLISIVRGWEEGEVIAALQQANVASEVMLAAGAIALNPPKRKLPDKGRERRVEQAVHLHLASLDLGLTDVLWVHPNVAANVALDDNWETLRGERYLTWTSHLPTRVSFIAAHAGDSSSDMLIKLISDEVHPYGLTSKGFVVVDLREDHNAEARRRLADMGIDL